MLTSTLALLAVLLAPSPHHRFGLTEPMPRIEGTMRVASYNILNYFDQQDDPSLQGEYDDFGDNPGPTTFERCAELAAAIRAIDADVIALEEVESKEAIDWFRDRFLADMGYAYSASEDVGYYRGVEQSVLSRFPIIDVRTWPEADLRRVKRTGGGWSEVPGDAEADDFTFQRSPLFVTVQHPNGYELSLFAVHHKAGRDRWRREGEALQIMDLVNELSERDPDRNIIVLGDFNAQPWDRSMQVYLRGGMVDAMTLRGANSDHDDSSPCRKTHTSGRIIDFILLNGGAVDELVDGSGFVLGTSGEEYNWRTDPIPPGYASDHYPIVIDMVPVEGAGDTVAAAKWPVESTRTAMRASPPRQSAPRKTASSASPKPKPAGSDDAGAYMASKRSKKFHKAGCGNAKRISEKNRVSYASIADAEADGKEPAGCCKPGS
ncbi:MAG: endonuclease/exonuclease/phosphatase family protein [Phycisphaerales bacterium]|jgi:endonuclease/exonuclease/phosphatase family metal-dependent hydrolase|nr:endonuclease/exonuclease/phosphatase family protein [Phycisphaerales bacterium]